MSTAWQLQRVNHNVKNFGDVARALAIINKNLEVMASKEGVVQIAAGSSGTVLPSQAGQSGKVLGTISNVLSWVAQTTAYKGMLPLVNGVTPGPVLMEDTVGQCIGVPLQ